MVRTGHDSWDVTEAVGVTALGAALARAQESASAEPLFRDVHAQAFIDELTSRGWTPSAAFAEQTRTFANYAACRTRWFDDFFATTGAMGIRQAVIVAAGLDARGWQLPWAADTTLFEIDQPRVLEFKVRTLRRAGAQSTVERYVPVGIDLRLDWPRQLLSAGFDPSLPAAWSIEGLLPYLPATGQDLLFERIHSLSAPGSRLAVEALAAEFFEATHLHRPPAGDDGGRDTLDMAQLWYLEERSDTAAWLTAHGWRVHPVEADALMGQYRRQSSPADMPTPKTLFITAIRRLT